MNRAQFLAHAQTGRYRWCVESARHLCGEWLARIKNPSVAFSGGKDSTVVLHIVRSIHPKCPAHYSHPEYELDETRALLNATQNLCQYAYRNRHADWFTAWENPSIIPDGVVWFDGKTSAAWAVDNGIDGVAVGIRAEENAYRRIVIRKMGALFYAWNKRIWQSWMIHNWTVEDVWAYILSNDVPYNQAYNRMDDANIPLKDQRIGPFANRRALDRGQLTILRTVFPEQFNRFAATHPEAGSYT
jgi:3'-phosphoadenosine 5'-phosphosulfate sulfotransferase (PAPS reductase)/FAD synthetase